MVRTLIISFFLCLINQVNGQTYVRSMDIGYTIQVTIVYDDSGDEPSLDFIFHDGFEFYSVTKDYSDDYAWSVKFDEDTEVAKVRIGFYDGKREMTVSSKLNTSAFPEEHKVEIFEHLDMMFGSYSLKPQ